MRVYTGGTFDLVHPGHIRLLKAARRIALAGPDSEVIVSLNRDEFIERYKGHRPVQTLHERMQVVAALRYVDRVIVNEGDEDSKPAILSVGPAVIVIGEDWAPLERYCKQMDFTPEWLHYHGITVDFVPRGMLSSGDLRARVQQAMPLLPADVANRIEDTATGPIDLGGS